MFGEKKTISDMSNEVVGRIIGFLGIMDGRRANRVSRDWHSIYTQPHEQKKRVENYFPARELGISDTDFESIFRAESKKLLKKLFTIVQDRQGWQDHKLLKAFSTEQIMPYIAAALAGEVSHVDGLGKVENDFLYMLAASHGHVDLTQLDERQMKWAICIAAAFGCAKIVEALLKTAAADTEGFVLMQAATYGHLDIVKLLPGDLSLKNGVRALFKAAENGHYSVVAYLYSQIGGTMAPRGKSLALGLAVQHGHHAIVEYLYPQVVGALSAKDKTEALRLAAKHGHHTIVAYLYQQMVDTISVKDKGQVLIIAAQHGHRSIVEYLYPQMADGMFPEDKSLALSRAAQNNHQFIVEYLYPLIANALSAKDKGKTLAVAVQYGHYSIVVYLYLQMASVILAEDKKKALILASFNGYLQIVKYFLEQHGNDFSIKFIQEALSYAKNVEIVNYLEEIIKEMYSLELSGYFNGVALTSQFDHSCKQDQSNQTAIANEAAPSAGWRKAPKG